MGTVEVLLQEFHRIVGEMGRVPTALQLDARENEPKQSSRQSVSVIANTASLW
jgi:hypothetical protein